MARDLEPSRQTSARKMSRERQGQMRVGSRTVSRATGRGKVHFAGLCERDCGVLVGPPIEHVGPSLRRNCSRRRMIVW